MSMGDAAMVIGRAVTGVLLCASGLAIYNEGVVPLIRKRRMLKQWPSEGDAEDEENEEEGMLNKDGSSAVIGLNTDIRIVDNKEHIQQSDTQNEITKVHIPRQLEIPSGSTSQRLEQVWDQKKSTPATKHNVKEKTFEQTGASSEDVNGKTNVQRALARGVRLYDWSAKWKD
jgi:hypothetical protein